MAVAAPKIAVHLYLNNPYGLVSATIPNYTVNKVDLGDKGLTARKSESESPTFRKDEKPCDADSAISESAPKFKARKILSFKDDEEFGKQLKPLDETRNGSWNSPSSDKNAPPPLVHFDKSSRQNHPKRAGSKNGSPLLGITWSINVDKRDKVVIPRQPPPISLLEKLGRLKSVEPVGFMKLKRAVGPVSPHNYLIHRIQLGEKGQRRMSEKLSEWLDQYTEVSQKQQDYLKRIHELRWGLEHKDKRLISTIDKMRGEQKSKYRRKYPLYSLSRMEESPVNYGPAPFPNRPSLFHDDKHGVPKLKIAPHTTPRKLAPIVTRVKTEKYNKMLEETGIIHQITPRPEMATMKTEYETFESIAKRNKLSLTQFFNSTLSHRRSHKRLPMNVSTVTILEETPDDLEQREFITDISSRKPVVANTIKDQKPG